jgi:hypothetical protein
MSWIVSLESDFLEPSDPGPPPGIVILYVSGLIVGSASTNCKVSTARRMARDAGMNEGDATAMTLLSDDGFEATYLASNLRPPAPAPQPQPGRSSADRLRELQTLLDQGLITQAEHDARRQAIIDGL